MKGRVPLPNISNIIFYAKWFFLGVWPPCPHSHHSACPALPPAVNELAIGSGGVRRVADSPRSHWCSQTGSGAIDAAYAASVWNWKAPIHRLVNRGCSVLFHVLNSVRLPCLPKSCVYPPRFRGQTVSAGAPPPGGGRLRGGFCRRRPCSSPFLHPSRRPR